MHETCEQFVPQPLKDNPLQGFAILSETVSEIKSTLLRNKNKAARIDRAAFPA